MKYLKFIVILMGLLIFFGTSAILYIVFDKLFSKEKLIFPQKDELKQLQISENIKLNKNYQIIIYDLKSGKQLYFFETN